MSIGKLIQEGWHNLASKHGLNIDIGGIPPLSHFSFEYDNASAMKALFVQLMIERGFMASNLFYAMYAHKMEHVEKYIHAVGESFAIISDALQTGQLRNKMKCKPAGAGFKRLT